ncbi:MAG: Zeta toxin family protein, partial [Deinococcota bacterium]|nr:Zeta toxin family protein [Deinococcota bacterium]
FQLLYLWLPSAELAIARVKTRVRLGGHDVPEGTIRRRYHAGLKNFFSLYAPLANSWAFYDNGEAKAPMLIAACHDTHVTVRRKEVWQQIQEAYA